MTGMQILDFLKNLPKEDLELDVDIRRKDEWWWCMGVGVDCSGIHLMDDETTAIFESECLGSERLLTEGGTYEF